MSFGMAMRSLFEVALVAFTLWALFHEDRIAAMEDRFFARCRRKRLTLVKPHTAGCEYARRGF